MTGAQDDLEIKDSDISVDQEEVDLKCLESDEDEVATYTVTSVDPVCVNKNESAEEKIKIEDAIPKAIEENEDGSQQQLSDEIKNGLDVKVILYIF